MRKTLLALALCAMCCLAPTASAGLYFTEEEHLWPPGSTERRLWPIEKSFTGSMVQRTLLNTPKFRERIGERIAALQQKQRQNELTLEDRINLSAYYLIRGEPGDNDEAFALLHRQTRGNFMALANLAMVHQNRQEYLQAVEMMQEALRRWPEIYPGWTRERLQSLRRAELFYLNLLKSRALEQRSDPRGARGVDNVFPGVSFETRDGKYVPGSIPARSRDALPPDAVEIMRQLRIWMPFDTRLRWLYAEVLNANGQIIEAESIMNNFSEPGFQSPQRREHMQILKRAVGMIRLLEKNFRLEEQQALLLGLAPSAPLTVAPIEPLIRAKLASSARSLTRDEGFSPTFPDTPGKPEEKTPTEEASASLLSGISRFQLLLCGLGAGIVAGVLLLYQIQEIRRRRR